MRIIKKCLYCGIEFSKKAKESYKQFNSRKFCSKKCKGKATPKNILEKFHNAGVEASRGKPSWNKGLKCPQISKGRLGIKHSEESRKKMSETRKILLIERKIKVWNKGVNMWKNRMHPRGTLGKTSKFRDKTFEQIYGSGRAEKIKSKIRKKTLQQYEQGDFPKQTHTQIELKVKAELIRRGYKEGTDFIHQYNFNGKFMCDFAFPKQRIIIECWGDFWHANPVVYPYNPETFKNWNGKKLYPHQIKDIKRDKAKMRYIAKCGWRPLFFWEWDIKHPHNFMLMIDSLEEILKSKKARRCQR